MVINRNIEGLRFQFSNLTSEDRNFLGIISICGLVFCVIPWLGVSLSVISIFITNNKKALPFCLIVMLFYVGLIQSQRELIPIVDNKSDWGNYRDFYSLSSNFDFIYSERGAKDIGFTLWNYICFKFFGNRFLCFADFTVDVMLLLLSLSAYRIWSCSGKDARYCLCSFVMIFFLGEIMLISNNLLRQQFATSLMIYGFVLKNTIHNKKNRWWLLFLCFGFLCHSMTVVFVPLYFLSLSKKPSKKFLMYALAAVLIFVLFYGVLSNTFIGSSLYFLQRIGNAKEYFQSDVIDPSVIYKFAFIIFIIYFKHYYLDRGLNKYIWIGANAILYITLVCIITADMPLLVTRVYITRLGLLALFIPYIFPKKSCLNTIFQATLILFFCVRFMLLTHNEYIDIREYSLNSIFSLL